MNRVWIVLSLLLSTIAVALVVVTLVARPEPAVEPDAAAEVRRVRLLLEDMRDQLAEVADRQDRLEESMAALEASSAVVAKTGGDETPETMPETVQPASRELVDFEERLARLEDTTNIARMAQKGSDQIKRDRVEAARQDLLDPRLHVDERLAALDDLPKNERLSSEVVGAMRGLATDTSLDEAARTRAIEALEGSMLPEVRRDLLDLLLYDDSDQVRMATIGSLMWHGANPNVRETITRISQSDRHDNVRARARQYLPKVEWFAENPPRAGNRK